MTIPVGQLIAGRYEVLDSLGSAGQGDVYRVRDTYENAICVLKLLNVATLTAGTWDEAQILRDLADDHILEIRNADLYAGQPYIVTALAEHGTLETELAATNGLGLDADPVVTWMRQASMGVARAHDKSLVHNDIKPANLFLTANKECLVGDFGLASRVPPLPLVGVARGATPETAAPEVRAGWATGVPPAAFTTDVYSLGATAYWLLAARPPVNLAGITGIPARMAAAATQTTPRLRDVAPHVPAPVASIIDRAMAVDPADRYQTVGEFSAALGSRSTKPRRWRRTNEHAGHLGCWRGERPGKSSYILCLEQGATPKQCGDDQACDRRKSAERFTHCADAGRSHGRPRDDRQALLTARPAGSRRPANAAVWLRPPLVRPCSIDHQPPRTTADTRSISTRPLLASCKRDARDMSREQRDSPPNETPGRQWAYRYRSGGRGSRRVQRGGFASEQDARDALERELKRVRRERRISRSLTLAELVETYLAQHDVQPVTIEKLRYLLSKATAVFGDRRNRPKRGV